MSREAAFIETLRAIATDPAARGLADDAAVLDLGGESLILTHDMMVEGTHFLRGQDMADVAWKLVASNISDLAAKGAAPLGVLLGYTLAPKDNGHDARFAEGLAEALTHFGAPLLGGDTVAAPTAAPVAAPAGSAPRTFGLTAIGRATHRPVPSRSGAKVGDGLFVTGAVGAAMMGFEALRDAPGPAPGHAPGPDSAAYRRPQARLAEGQALAAHVTAMMDISDGLLLDSWRMAQASAVSLAISSTAVPIAAPAGRRLDAMRWGDDYELLFTLPAGLSPPVPATRIGTVEPLGFAPLFLDGEPVINADGLGYQHG